MADQSGSPADKRQEMANLLRQAVEAKQSGIGGTAKREAGGRIGSAAGAALGRYAGGSKGAQQGRKLGREIGSGVAGSLSGSDAPEIPPSFVDGEDAERSAQEERKRKAGEVGKVAGQAAGKAAAQAAATAATGGTGSGTVTAVAGKAGAVAGGTVGKVAGRNYKKVFWTFLTGSFALFVVPFLAILVIFFGVLTPAATLVNFGDKVESFFGFGDKDERQELLDQIPDDVKDNLEKFKDVLAQNLDCSAYAPVDRDPGNNCQVGLLSATETSAGKWSPIPDSAFWLVPVWKAAGKRYGVPWEVIAALNGARTSFGKRMCSATEGEKRTSSGSFSDPFVASSFDDKVAYVQDGETGFYRLDNRLWADNSVDAGSADTAVAGTSFCETSVEPASVDKDFKKPVETLAEIKGEPKDGNPYDAVDSTFAMGRILAREGAFRAKEWDYKGSGPGLCTVTERAGQISYPPTPPGISGGAGKGGYGYNKKLDIPKWLQDLGNRYRFKPTVSFSAESIPPPIQAKMMRAVWSLFGARGATLNRNVTLNLAQIKLESGGSPGQIQYCDGSYVDTNCDQGNPARGLFQYIPETFDTWRVSGFEDIYNPLHQMLATVNAQVNSDMAILDGSSGWGPGSGSNPYAKGGKKVAEVSSGSDKGQTQTKPQPYRGKAQSDRVSGAVRSSAATRGDDCYVAVIHEWYRLIKKYPPDIPFNIPGMGKGFQKLYQPRKYVPISAKYCPDNDGCEIDARIFPNMMWMLKAFDMIVTDGRDTGHATHGDGTALDLVPRVPDEKGWDKVDAAARFTGWTRECGYSGRAPICPLTPAFTFIGYDGFAEHGRGHHLHISWANDCYGCGGGALVPPRNWIVVFGSSSTPGGKAGGGPKAWTGDVLRGKVSFFNGPASTTASGSPITTPGVALNLKPGTDSSGWNNKKTQGWIASGRDKNMFYCAAVTIKNKTANLAIIDLGPHETTDRAIDVTEAGIAKLGFNAGNFPTDSIGTAKIFGPVKGTKCRGKPVKKK